MMRQLLTATILALLAGAIGCDDKPAVSVTPEPVKAGPTTQELISGPRVVLPLKVMPLSIKVPQSWKVDISSLTVTFLQGPSPAGNVQIQLATRTLLKPNLMDSLILGAQKEAATDPHHAKIAVVRDVNGMKVLEKREMPTPSTQPAPGAAQNPLVDDVAPFITWELTYFVPREGSFEPCQFNFVGLTTEQFNSDEKFLRALLDTIQHDEASELQVP